MRDNFFKPSEYINSVKNLINLTLNQEIYMKAVRQRSPYYVHNNGIFISISNQKAEK